MAEKIKSTHANIGFEFAYRSKLLALLAEMHNSVMYWVKAAWDGPEIVRLAQDKTPAAELKVAMRDLRKRWTRKYDDAAHKLAKWFAHGASSRTDAQLKNQFRKAGFTVNFKLTEGQRNILDATVAENVALIKSIPEQYLTAVEGAVMRSVVAGRDLHTLSETLQREYGVTKRRAAFIARDQNNKIHGSLENNRQRSIGIKEAYWRHSHGDKIPRPTHFAADGTKYSLVKGMWDPDAYGKGQGAWIFPGQLPNCTCFSSPIIPGLEDEDA